MTARRRSVRRAEQALWLLLPVLLVVTLLAACDSGSSGAAHTSGAASPGSASGSVTSTVSATTIPTDTPTLAPISGPGGQIGTNRFCSQPPAVSVQLPASIPSYPNGQLRLSQADGSNSIYGVCTSDSVSVAIQYYMTQLPQKGWQQLKQNQNDPVQQVTAKQSGTNVTITIYPDADVANVTDVIIQLVAA